MVISVLVEISFNNKEKTFDYLVQIGRAHV